MQQTLVLVSIQFISRYIMSNLRSLLLSVARENGISVDDAANSLHTEIEDVLSAYKAESEKFASVCENVIAENPSVSKEALPGMVAMQICANNPTAFPRILKSVSEYVDLTYTGKRGRRSADDNSVRLFKKA